MELKRGDRVVHVCGSGDLFNGIATVLGFDGHFYDTLPDHPHIGTHNYTAFMDLNGLRTNRCWYQSPRQCRRWDPNA